MKPDLLRHAVASLRGLLAGRTKVQASLWYASSSLVCQALRFAGLILSTRLIGKEQFGFFAQGLLAFELASLVRNIGQTYALVGYRGGDRRYAVFNFQINAGLGILAAVLLWLVLAAAPGLPTELRRAASLLALATLADTLLLTGLIMAQKDFRFGLLARVEIGSVAVWLGTLAVAIPRLEGCLALFTALLGEVVFRFIALFVTTGWRYVGWARGRDLRRYYFSAYARHLIPQNILQALSGRLDFLLLSILATRAELGIYERMLQFIRIPWSLSINLMDRVLLASYSREQDDPAALRRTLRKSMRVIAVAVLLAAGAVTLGMALVLKFFVGPDWARTIESHWWIALPLTLVTPFVWNLNILYQGTGRAAQLLRNTAFLFLVSLPAGLLAAPYGAASMLIAQGAVYAALLAFQIRGVRIALAEKSPAGDPPPKQTP